MIPRSYEGIIPKVTANVCLNNFPADTIAGNEIFILALRARVISRASSHFVIQEKGSPRLNKVIKNHGSKWPQWKKSGTGQVQPRSKKMGKTKSSPRFGLIVLSCMEESKSRREVQFYLTVCVQGNSKADNKWLIRLFSSFLFLSRNKHTTQQAVRA